MKYVMVTQLANHWDNVSATSYPKSMIRKLDYIMDNVETIFIKLDIATGRIKKAWKGYIYNVKRSPNKILFRVNLDTQIPLSQVRKYSRLKGGWYIYDIKAKSST